MQKLFFYLLFSMVVVKKIYIVEAHELFFRLFSYRQQPKTNLKIRLYLDSKHIFKANHEKESFFSMLVFLILSYPEYIQQFYYILVFLKRKFFFQFWKFDQKKLI